MKTPDHTSRILARVRHTCTALGLWPLLLAAPLTHAAKPPLPIPGQLPPRVSAPAVEPESARPVPLKQAVREWTPAEVRTDPAQGAYVTLRDLAPSPRPERSSDSRFHVQGDSEAPAPHRATDGDAPFRKTAASPASPLPTDGHQRDAGDLVRSFDAIADLDSVWTPPDMVIAAGPAHVVEAVNSGFSVYTKFGTPVTPTPGGWSYWNFDTFFDSTKPAGWSGFMFDPRILFDPVRERFVMLALGKDEITEDSYVFLALSETSDPTGEWCTRRISATDTSSGSRAWLDYAGLGADQWGLYITGNLFYWSGGKRGAQIHSFDTDIFEDCTQSLVSIRYPDVSWPSGGQADSLQPALPHTINGDEETFFVGTYPASGDKVLLARLSGDRASSPVLTRVEIDIPAYNAIGNNVDQPGSGTDLDGGKSKVQNAVYSNRRVFFALTDDVHNDGSAAGWLTVKLDTALNTKEWHHLLWGGEGIYYFYPALTLDGTGTNNNLAVFGSWTDAETVNSAETRYASGLYKLYENQPVDGSGRFVSVAPGEGSYVRLDTNGRNRWGDYSGASYDWTCGHAWGVVEYADAGNQWATRILAREFSDEGPCPLMEMVAPNAATVWSGGTTQTVSWLSSGLPATDEIYVYAFTDQGVFTVAEGLPSTYTSVNWTVPEVSVTDALIAAGSWDGSAYTALAWSAPFEIVDSSAPLPDPMQWATAPHPLASDRIAMAAAVATDGSGGPVEYYFEFTGSPFGGGGGNDSGWQASTTYADAGLLPNREYCYRVRARDEAGNAGAYSGADCAYTLAADPIPAGFSQVTGLSVRVNWNPGGNPPDTGYLVEGQPGNLSSGPVTGTSWNVPGLTGGTPYSFRIRARNADGVTTDWVNLGSVTTLADDPDGDGVPATVDNCPAVANTAQRDTDGDGIGNTCDADIDNDCSVSFGDLAALKAAFIPNPYDPDADFNGDGFVNFNDLAYMKATFYNGANPGPGPGAPGNACE